MSWRDEKPAVSYEKAWDATEEVRQVKLTQEYQDGTHKEIKVPIDDGSKGPEYLIMVVMDEFDDAAEELDYTNDELFINFARVLKGNTKFLWQNVTDGLTDAQKTTARFKQAKKELIQAIVGPNQRNIMKSWLQNKCGKPLGVGPLVHLGRIQELIRLTNAFDGTESKIDAAGAKDILLATCPKPWRERYLTSARELSTDSMLDIAQYMNRLWMIEELSGRGRNNNSGKGKKRYRRQIMERAATTAIDMIITDAATNAVGVYNLKMIVLSMAVATLGMNVESIQMVQTTSLDDHMKVAEIANTTTTETIMIATTTITAAKVMKQMV